MQCRDRFLEVRTIIAILSGSFCGWLIWALSPWLGGHTEPWDANPIYYPLALGMSGLLFGVLHGARFWTGLLGLYIGQVSTIYCGIRWIRHDQSLPATGHAGAYMPFSGWSPAILVLVFCVLALFGCLLGWLVRPVTAKSDPRDECQLPSETRGKP